MTCTRLLRPPTLYVHVSIGDCTTCSVALQFSPIGTTVLSTVRATDADPDNWVITYHIIPGNYSVGDLCSRGILIPPINAGTATECHIAKHFTPDNDVNNLNITSVLPLPNDMH